MTYTGTILSLRDTGTHGWRLLRLEAKGHGLMEFLIYPEMVGLTAEWVGRKVQLDHDRVGAATEVRASAGNLVVGLASGAAVRDTDAPVGVGSGDGHNGADLDRPAVKQGRLF